MKINFTLNISDKITNFKIFFYELEDKVNSIIEGGDYGKDLLEVYVGWICVAPEYESFFKPRRSKFYDNKEMSVDGRKFTLTNSLEYETKLDYNIVLNLTIDNFRQLIINEFITSLYSNIKASKKLKNFDAERLVNDLKVDFYEK